MRKSFGQSVVRANQVNRALNDLQTQTQKETEALLQRYHEEFVLPIIARQRAPWFVRFWYDYLRPLLALYGFVR